ATSIDQALTAAAGFLPSPSVAQKDYILLITDNLSPTSLAEQVAPDENAPHPCGGTVRNQVDQAAAVAQGLFNGAKKIETLVVAVGSTTNGVNVNYADLIAHAGTG